MSRIVSLATTRAGRVAPGAPMSALIPTQIPTPGQEKPEGSAALQEAVPDGDSEQPGNGKRHDHHERATAGGDRRPLEEEQTPHRPVRCAESPDHTDLSGLFADAQRHRPGHADHGHDGQDGPDQQQEADNQGEEALDEGSALSVGLDLAHSQTCLSCSRLQPLGDRSLIGAWPKPDGEQIRLT